MLRKCSNALLLTNVESFSQLYSQYAEELGISLRVEKEWNVRYRVTEEVVICGSKYLESLHRSYYGTVVLILKEGESPAPYIKEGVTRFIFDYQNRYELALALYRPEKVFVAQQDTNVKTVLEDSLMLSFELGDYKFNFQQDRFFYKGKGLYLTKTEKVYLADWLLNGHKDNSKRNCLFNMRKKFGNDFLKNINRFGQLREENTNEQ